MIPILSVLFSVVIATCGLTITRDGFYDTKYNYLDIERVLNNKRLVYYYGQCLLGEGPCTPQGTEFKRILPEALQTNCARCTEKQKITAYLAIKRLKKEYPKIWQQLQAAWDPKGEHVSKFINDVETNTNLDGIKIPATINNTQNNNKQEDVASNQIPNVINRFGGTDEDNSINSVSSPATNQISQTKAPTLSTKPLQNAPAIQNMQATASSNNKNNVQTIPITTTARPVPQVIFERSTTTQQPFTSTERITTTPEIIFRPPLRPVLGRPLNIGQFASNMIAQMADMGTKVIKAGARIADVMISGVQASVRPIFVNNRNRDQ